MPSHARCDPWVAFSGSGITTCFWFVFGGLAGWGASLVAGTNDRQGCLLNIVFGIAGAFVGGLIVELMTGNQFTFGWGPTSFVVAVGGALILLVILAFVRRSLGRPTAH